MNRKAIAALLAAALLAGCSQAPAKDEEQKLSIIELVPENDKVLAGEKSDIEIKTDPSDEVLTSANFDAPGAVIDVNGHTAVFSADKPGSYTIKAGKDGIESNPITIEVEDAASPDNQKTDNEPSKQDSGKTDDSTDTQTQNNRNQNDQTQNSSSAQNSGSSNETNSDLTGAITIDELYANPDAYVNKQVTINGYTPQDLPENKQAVLPNGEILAVIFNKDSSEGLPLENEDQNQLTPYVQVSGVFKKQNCGPYAYLLDVSNVTPLSPHGSAFEAGAVYTGDPAKNLPAKGTFTFNVNDVNIRNGTDGKSSPASGLVFKSGMSVNYDGTYQKDGYTWITWTGRTGERHSAAVGTGQIIEYGYAVGS